MSDAGKIKLQMDLAVSGQGDWQAANKGLEQTKAAANDLAKEMGVITVSGADVEKILARTGESAQEAGKKIEESSEHAKHHAGSAREMHHAFHALNEIVPGLGTAIKAAFHPEEIGLMGVVVAFEALKTVLEDIKAIDEIKLVDFEGSRAAVEAMRDSYEKMQVAARLFAEDQARVHAAGATPEDAAKRQIDNFKNLGTAQQQYLDARKKMAETGIDEQEKQGLITHDQAIKAKFALDVEYAQQRLALEARLDAQILAAKKAQLKTEQDQLAAAKADLPQDEANAEAAAAAKAKHDKQLDTAKGNEASAKTALEELGKSHGTFIKGQLNEENIGKLEEYFNSLVPTNQRKGDESHVEMFEKLQAFLDQNTISHGHLDSGGKEIRDARLFLAHDIGTERVSGPELAKYDLAQQQLKDAKAEQRRLEESQFKVDLTAEQAKKQLDATEGAVSSGTKSVDKLSREIPQDEADNKARQNNSAGLANLDLRTTAIGMGLPDPGNFFRATAAPVASTAADPVTNPAPWRDTGAGPGAIKPEMVQHMEDAYAHSNNIGEVTASNVQQLSAVLHTSLRTTEELAAIIRDAHYKHESLAATVSRLREEMGGQINGSRNTQTSG